MNENVGGHRAMHIHLRRALSGMGSVEATFIDVPPPANLRRLFGAPVPLLRSLDADLQPFRWQLAQSWEVRRRLEGAPTRYDALHVYTQNAALLSSSQLRAMPSVVSTDTTNLVDAYQLPYRRPGPFTGAALRVTTPVERGVFEAATLIVAQSQWTADQMAAYRVPSDRIRIIPFGITVPELLRPEPGPGLPMVTFVGTTMERKGGGRLLRVFEEGLRDRCRLSLVTRDPVPERPGVEVIADISPGDPRLHQLLKQSAVFALPTEIDKVPYSVLEAMAAAVPVVATRVGAVPELVDDGVTGILVNVGDDRALSEAIARLLDDPALRRRMGEAGRRRLEERFDARLTTTRLVEVLNEARVLHAERHVIPPAVRRRPPR